MSLYMNQKKAHVACNFNCLIVTVRLLNVTASHVRCKCGNLSDPEAEPDLRTLLCEEFAFAGCIEARGYTSRLVR